MSCSHEKGAGVPGIVAHYAFGHELHRELGIVIGTGEAEREAFLLGNLERAPAGLLPAVRVMQAGRGRLKRRLDGARGAPDLKSGGGRNRLDYLTPLGPLRTYLGALSFVDAARETTPFTNPEHTPWPHAFEEGATISASQGMKAPWLAATKWGQSSIVNSSRIRYTKPASLRSVSTKERKQSDRRMPS